MLMIAIVMNHAHQMKMVLHRVIHHVVRVMTHATKRNMIRAMSAVQSMRTIVHINMIDGLKSQHEW